MRISKIINANGSIEIYFIDLNYWEEFDLIIDILIKEFNCRIIKKQEGIYSKLCCMKKDTITFEIRHDDMLGNYIYTENKEDSQHLMKLAQNVIDKIAFMLEVVKK